MRKGFSLLELIFTVMFIGIVSTMAVGAWNELNEKSVDSANLIVGHLKKIRSRAISIGKAHRMFPVSMEEMRVSVADKCTSLTWTTEATLTLKLKSPSHLEDTTWVVCYDSFGLSSSSLVFNVNDNKAVTGVQVEMGGSPKRL